MLTKLQRFIEENLYGILGTIIFHLLIANVFMYIRMSSLKSKQHIEFAIEFEELPEEETIVPKDEKKEFIEQELQQLEQQHRSNIAVNKANRKMAENLSTEKYIEQVKQENNIDDLFPEHNLDKSFFPDINVNKEKKEKKYEEERKEYTGPTNITYYLKNRYDRYLHVPVYKCMGGGKVVLSIVVDQKGYVVSSKVEKVASDSNEPDCLIRTAEDALSRSRFNTDFNAENRQEGRITYLFVPQ